MKLSTRMRYGTRVLVQLGLSYPDKLTSLRNLAKDQNLSAKYLEKIMARLKLSGLVKVMRGGMGGYRLALPPNRITLFKVYQILESPKGLLACINNPEKCRRSSKCLTRPFWIQLEQGFEKVLQNSRLSDLFMNFNDKRPVSKTGKPTRRRKGTRVIGICP